MKIFLCGKHSNRTPFAYGAYKKLFVRYCTYVNNPLNADFIVFGFIIDIRENIELIERVLKGNRSAKFVVLSEEPFWDTMWSGGFTQKEKTVIVGELEVKLHILNHHTTNIFNFNTIPYFVTTSDDYIIRYQNLFTQNTKLSCAEIKKSMENAKIKAAFYAEHRSGGKFAVEFPEASVKSLCTYRTEIAESVKGKGVSIVGLGWEKEEKRQSLPDWHLDKLAALNRQCKIISAIENTHQCNYVTEKIFDAFALLAIPIYYACPNHRLHQIINTNSYINLYGKNVAEAKTIIDRFHITEDYINYYELEQLKMKNNFSNYEVLYSERRKVVRNVITEIKALV